MVEIQEVAAVTTVQTSTDESRSERFPEAPLDSIPVPGYYQIEDIRQSECARILFARHTQTSERVVMKILREYQDTRYSLETIGMRQQCQLEALQRNRVFTPEVYIGLGRIHAPDLCKEQIFIDEIIEDPTKEMLDPDAEYALMMHQLPEERRLDRLLSEECENMLTEYVHVLCAYVAHMHTNLVKPPDTDKDEIQWGSYEQLRRKLLHNLGLLDLVLTTGKLDQYRTLDLSKGTLHWLKETLLQVFMESHYRSYFEQRVREQRIKRCHGDLKSPNIWILSPDQSCDKEPGQCVKILDAIDFNPSYSNIDTLSDFAMLVIDVQVRTKSSTLSNEMVEYYLELTGQDNQAARSVLAFYLVEKAVVGAAISIVYDNLPDLGLSLLDIASMRRQCLVDGSVLIRRIPS
jgi:aminoglycoside phosphotransferase family enzyme